MNSHVIPKSFFKFAAGGSLEQSRLASVSKYVYPKKVPNGVYDQIICQQCEDRFSECDGHAYDVLCLQEPTMSFLDGQPVKTLPAYNYKLLNYFFLSLLWRASVSGQPFYKAVNLGQKITQLRKIIKFGLNGGLADFQVMISLADSRFGKAVATPTRSVKAKMAGITYYTFYLGRYLAHLKADKRPFPANTYLAQLSLDHPTYLVEVDYISSGKAEIFYKAAAHTGFKN